MQTSDGIVVLGAFAQIITAALAAIALIFGAWQLSHLRRTAHGEFLISLDQMFDKYRDVQAKLRPGGPWADGPNAGPVSTNDWLAVELYMGLFTRLKVLLDQRLLDLATVDQTYGHRLFNLIHNRRIYDEKLVIRGGGWPDLIALWHDLAMLRSGRHPHARVYCRSCSGADKAPVSNPARERGPADSMTPAPHWLDGDHI